MLIVRICDGLGNQLFQYAFGRQLARLRPEETVAFDIAVDESYATPREYLLPRFGLTLSEPPRQQIDQLKGRTPWWRRYAPRFHKPPPTYFASSQTWGFEPAVFWLQGDRYLDGYWQNPRYFEDIASELRREIVYRQPIAPPDLAVLRQIAACDAISLHVRRGDYIALQPASFAGVCSPAYYREAVARLLPGLASPHIFLFSDDPEWVERELSFDCPTTMVSKPGPDRSAVELWLMSRCHHHIIANSTFSWWGAWLNPNPAKKVIAPDRWVRTDWQFEGIYPPEWIRI